MLFSYAGHGGAALDISWGREGSPGYKNFVSKTAFSNLEMRNQMIDGDLNI
jgi:hypothetical protein